MQWKTNLASATQPISSIVIFTTKVLMQCVTPLLIWTFLWSNLREKEYRKFNRVLRMRVSGKKQNSTKQKNDLLCSTNFQRIKSKYISKLRKMLYRNKDNNSTYFTFSILFAKYKREEVEIRHVPSCYDKKRLP